MCVVWQSCSHLLVASFQSIIEEQCFLPTLSENGTIMKMYSEHISQCKTAAMMSSKKQKQTAHDFQGQKSSH